MVAGNVGETVQRIQELAGEKSLLAAVMKGMTSVGNRWLAERLEMGTPSTASQAARRVLLDKKRKKEVERILREIRKTGVRNGWKSRSG